MHLVHRRRIHGCVVGSVRQIDTTFPGLVRADSERWSSLLTGAYCLVVYTVGVGP